LAGAAKQRVRAGRRMRNPGPAVARAAHWQTPTHSRSTTTNPDPTQGPAAHGHSWCCCYTAAVSAVRGALPRTVPPPPRHHRCCCLPDTVQGIATHSAATQTRHAAAASIHTHIRRAAHTHQMPSIANRRHSGATCLPSAPSPLQLTRCRWPPAAGAWPGTPS
jgi:hypothetical protein